MSLYERIHIKPEKKPVCIIGMPKEVEARHVRTGGIKRSHRVIDNSESPLDTQSPIKNPEQMFSTYSPITKT
jgi:hypothetical protein